MPQDITGLKRNGQEKKTPPPSTEIAVPDKLAPIVAAFSAPSKEAAQSLIAQAARAIYANSDDFSFAARDATKEELDVIYELMQSLRPQDAMETLCASQIIAGHFLGMRKLAQSARGDNSIGIKLLRLSNDAMSLLVRKRQGGGQNITITYNNSAPSAQALITNQG
jgi:hypothetical protein